MLRQLENELLDTKFKEYTLLLRNTDTAMIHILKMYGDLLRDLNRDTEINVSLDQRKYFLWYLTDGLTYGVKWIASDCKKVSEEEYSYKQVDEEALELLFWGYNYSELCIEHTAYSKKMSDVWIDEEQKIVEFKPKEINPNLIISQSAFDRLYLSKLRDSHPHQELNKEFNLWFRETSFSYENIEIPWDLVKNLKCFTIFNNWIKDNIFWDLESTCSLGKYTLYEYIKIYSILYINFSYYTKVEDYIDIRDGLENELGSCSVCINNVEFINWLSELSDIDNKKVSEIVSDLTLDSYNFHSKIVFQP